MATRIVQLAFDEGVDLTDPGQVEDFMTRFNARPLEWRTRATDGPGGGSSGDDDFDEFDDDPLDVPHPDADPLTLGLQVGLTAGMTQLAPLVTFPLDRVATVTVPAADVEWAGLAATSLVGRVLELAQWAGPGRILTATSALRIEDMRILCARWGLPARQARARSMWDVPGIALPWRIALDCGVIDVVGRKAVPGADGDAFAGAIDDRVRLGRTLIERLLDFVLVPVDVAAELLNAINLLMLPMMRSMCVPPGQDLAGLDDLNSVRQPPGEDSFYPRLLAANVRSDIDMLSDWGVVDESGTHASIPTALRPAVVQTINSPLAPFRVSLLAGAVPVPHPGNAG